MTYEEFCENYCFPPSEGGKAIFDAARRSVAAEVAAMFGFAPSFKDCDRFFCCLGQVREGGMSDVQGSILQCRPGRLYLPMEA